MALSNVDSTTTPRLRNLGTQPIHPPKRPQFSGMCCNLIIAAMFTYAYGQLFYFSDTYSDLSITIGTWYGVPEDVGKDSGIANSDNIRFSSSFAPSRSRFFGVLELLKHYSMHRITSHYVLSFTRVLRRNPRIFGWVTLVSLEPLFLLFLIGSNAYIFVTYYWRGIAKGVAFAFTLGFVCFYNIAFPRNCVWMEFLNISYTNGIKYHHWIGVITGLTAFFHCLGYYLSWIRQEE
ncbi:hypothetical protein PHPALM_30021 [Phytophthora palmivora]|uniref:Ferric oxidoreductase domain-containing protein n=1 Tax=Phytophthora palmivora TaxID=4796 RepID=A0A2P4X658_9STRA|nr:hypothetical protein PHPALM_30021 [Phytophthora palmivora]